MMTRWLTGLSGLLLSLASQAAPLFTADDVLELELSGPLSALLKQSKDREPFPFTLRVGNAEIPVMLSARGKSRMEICQFPPLRLQFESPPPGDSVFQGQERLKLVTHCREAPNMQKNAVEEYAAYRFFSLLSEDSYRTRLLRIRYRDSGGRGDEVRYAFVLEATDQLAARIGATEKTLPGVSRKQLNQDHAALMYVFQYLIGNTDWSLVTTYDDEACCHNGKLLERDSELLYIPYDFDRAGIVNAGYAYPDRSLRIRRVTQRLYRGFCMDEAPVRAAIQATLKHRQDMINIAAGLPLLDADDREDMTDFLSGYFKQADNEDKLMSNFERRCID